LVNGHHPSLINGRLRLAIDADRPEFLEPEPIDSVVFFHYIFQTIRRYVPEAPLNLSEFDVLTTVRCLNCNEIIEIGRDKSVYVLPIEPAVVSREEIRDSMSEMINRWVKFEKLNWKCPKCHRKGGEFVRKIEKAPKYLFINNQLDYGEIDGDRFKRNMVLDMNQKELHIGCVEGESDVVYRLRSFMHHFGRWAKYGHDIAFVRYGEEWIKFNDHVAESIENLESRIVFGQQYLYLWEKLN
jgi:uncharacterized UBP type Zn finger protein